MECCTLVCSHPSEWEHLLPYWNLKAELCFSIRGIRKYYVLCYVSQDEVMKWTEEVADVSVKEMVVGAQNGPSGEVSQI